MSAPRPSRRMRGLRSAMTVAIAIVLVGTGATASYAGWTASVAKSASVSAGTIGVSLAGSAGLTAKYGPGPSVIGGVVVESPLTSITAPITVSNTGTVPLSYALSVSGGDNAIDPLISLTAWKVASGTDCTTAASIPASPASTVGTLAAPPALPAAASSGAGPSTLVLCVRTTFTGNPETAATTNALVASTIAVTGTVGTNWTTAGSGTFTQGVTYNWFEVKHNYSGKCLDGEAEQVTAGTHLILWPCKPLTAAANQGFRFIADATAGYYRIAVGNSVQTSPAVLQATTATCGSIIELNSVFTGTGTTSLRQQWDILANAAQGDIQLVNRGSGLCLTMSGSADLTDFTQTTCSTSTSTTNTGYRSEHFSLVAIP